MQTWLRCALHIGQFPSELAAVVRSYSGREYSLFVQKSKVRFEELPSSDSPVDGWIQVMVIKNQGNRCLVHLPQSTLENGQYLTVAVEQLERMPNPGEIQTVQ